MNPASFPSSLFAHRWIRRLAWTVAAVLSTWMLAWAIVPPVLEHQLEHRASAELGRSLGVGRIEFKPWTLELILHDVSMATQDGSAAQLAVRRIHVDAELESLWRLAPVVQSLEVDGPALRLRRTADGRYDVDDILHRFAGAPSNDTAPATDDEPLRFAVFNVVVRGGTLDVDDQAADRRHALRGLDVHLPFLSNLPSRRDITVTPSLAFTLNGAAFASQAVATPFAPSRKSDARVRIQSMDLEPYLPYVPAGLPVRLRRGVLDADLQLQFVREDRPQFIVRGHADLSGVDLADGAGEPLLALERLSVGIDALRPLDRQVHIGTVALQSPRLQARRDADGRLNLALAPTGGVVAVDPAADASGTPPDGAAWTVSMQHLAMRDGSVSWRDAAVAPQARLQLHDLTVDVDDLVWPMARAAQFKGALSVSNDGPVRVGPVPADQASTTARLVFDGSGTDRQATLQLTVTEAPLALAAPYLASFLVPQLHGQLDASMTLHWGDAGLRLAVPSLTLDRLALVHGGGAAQDALAQVQRIAVSSATVDLDRRTLQVDRLELRQPRLAVTRGSDQRWMFESWLKPGAAGGNPPAQAAGGAAPAPWTGRLAHAHVVDGTVRFEDAAPQQPVRLGFSGLQLDLQGFGLAGNEPIRTHLSARVATGQGRPGTIDYRGSVQYQPLQTQGRLSVERWPVHALEPYFGDGLNVQILRADAGFKGDIAFATTTQGPQWSLRGDTVLEDVRAESRGAVDGEAALGRELLNWQALGMRGVELAQAPGQPLRVAVRETSLSDFYARVIVHETGRLNLQDLVRGDAPAAPADVPVAAAAPATATPGAKAAVAAPADAPAATAPTPQIRIGPIGLVNGRVYFSDRFVKPNYSANLSELTGRLGAFSSAPAQAQAAMADLELRGRAEGTASLEILGKLNPLADPPALDIKGVVRDLELPALSPYAIKYAGHGIERGKLSVDVAYRVSPDGQLTASNQVVLNQLAFGDKVDGAPNSLPVKLAVALLADRNGVIDIDLPISGSLNDPQFQLGSVIVKVIVNLIGKALTAPFTLLASALGGGGDELSQVAFAPGSAQLQPQARSTLDKVAEALAQRPALRMTVVGTANLELEREAFKRVRLQALLQAEKRRAQIAAGLAPAAPDDASADDAAQAADTQERLRQLFARSEIARPRDLEGKPRELSTADMEALLLANIPVDEEAMRELALRRGVAVKDYLASRQLPVECLFLGAARLPQADATWSPRAELNLGTN